MKLTPYSNCLSIASVVNVILLIVTLVGVLTYKPLAIGAAVVTFIVSVTSAATVGIFRKMIRGEIDKFKQENVKLQDRVDEFSRQNNIMKDNLNNLNEENDQLAHTANELRITAASHHAQALKLEADVRSLSEINKKIGQTADKLEADIKSLNEVNEKLEQQNEQLGNSLVKLKDANKQLLLIQKQSQGLLENLMNAGDEFRDFSKLLGETTEKNLTLSDKLTLLVTELSHKKFHELDLDGDGIITHEEFHNN
jgi:chromosome segregation ATPase